MANGRVTLNCTSLLVLVYNSFESIGGRLLAIFISMCYTYVYISYTLSLTSMMNHGGNEGESGSCKAGLSPLPQ